MEKKPKIDINLLKSAVLAATGEGAPFTPRSLSLKASGGKNPDLVRDLIKRGQDRSPSFETIAGLANALGVDIPMFMAVNPAIRAGETIKVVGSVEAGAWRQVAEWDLDSQYDLAVMPAPVGNAERFGLEVTGYSMDKIFPPGIILDVLAIPGTPGLEPQVGDIVIVRRRQGDLIETTCKRLARADDNTLELRSESTRAEFSDPIKTGSPDAAHHIDSETTIIGIVNSAISQVFRR